MLFGVFNSFSLTIIALLATREYSLILLTIHFWRTRLWFWHCQELFGRCAIWLLNIIVGFRRFWLCGRHMDSLRLHRHRFILINVLLFNDGRILALTLLIVTKSPLIVFAESEPLLFISNENFDVLIKAICRCVKREQLVKIHNFLLKYINEII